MSRRQTSNRTLLISLVTLTAAAVVTLTALTSWTVEISERLSGQPATVAELPSNIVIGSVEGASTFGQTSTAPVPVYRPANERLPSQAGDQMMAQSPDEGVSEGLSDATNTSIEAPEDIWLDGLSHGAGTDASALTSTASATPDVIRQQAAILQEMRRAHSPSDGEFVIN